MIAHRDARGRRVPKHATVRAYVVTMAPEVAGRIVELHVVDTDDPDDGLSR
jgi:multidrug resistance efflux pump